MPHQNTSSSTATAQNTATDPAKAADQPDENGVQSEPRSYVAVDAAEASLAPPAAGEVADVMDEGDALAAQDVQQGSTHANRPEKTERQADQGPRTTEANRESLKH
jgi:hypothetical protein